MSEAPIDFHVRGGTAPRDGRARVGRDRRLQDDRIAVGSERHVARPFEVDVAEAARERPSEAVDGADLVGERLLEREHVLAVDRDRLASAELDDLYLLAVVCEVDVTLALDAHNRRSLAGGGLLEEARNSSSAEAFPVNEMSPVYATIDPAFAITVPSTSTSKV